MLLAALAGCPAPALPPPAAAPLGDGPADRDLQVYLADYGLRLVEVPRRTRSEHDDVDWTVVDPPPAEGLLAGEAMVKLSGRPRALAFVTLPAPNYCADPPVVYRVALADDGAVVVIRQPPDVTEVVEHRPGPCAVGCGPAPVFLRDVLTLPPAPAIRVASVPYAVTVTRVTCDDPRKAQ